MKKSDVKIIWTKCDGCNWECVRSFVADNDDRAIELASEYFLKCSEMWNATKESIAYNIWIHR